MINLWFLMRRPWGTALVLPRCNSAAMTLHLAEIARTVTPGAHAVLMLDQAGWHLSDKLVVPANITLLPLPPKGEIKWSSQHLDEGVAMGTRKRRSDGAGRGVLRSPGRPGVARREDRRRFWAAIAAGLASEDAACRAGVSPAVGTRWFREAGGMPPAALAPSSKPLCGRYLSFAEREEIALCRAQGQGIREVARRLGRAASTISRELRRDARR